MTNRNRNKFLAWIAVLAGLTAMASAAPNTIRIQARLTDNTGQPIASATDVRIQVALYPAATGGSAAWQTTGELQVATNDAGLFATDIGPIDAGVFSANPTLYLELRVRDAGGLKTLSPRQKLSAVPFAVRADAAGVSDTTKGVSEGAIGSREIADESIQSVDLATAAVRALNLADSSVTGAAIANNSITSDKLQAGTIKRDRLDESSFAATGSGLLPQGAIVMFLASCPSGFSEVVALRKRVPMGADTGGDDSDIPDSPNQALGSKTHVHNIEHRHQTDLPTIGGSAFQESGQGWVTFDRPRLVYRFFANGTGDDVGIEAYDHTHATVTQINKADNNPNTNSGPALTLPPALTVVFCSKN